MNDVIEISSSPEPEAGPSRKPSKPRPKPRPPDRPKRPLVRHEEVIELSDSDDDRQAINASSPSKKPLQRPPNIAGLGASRNEAQKADVPLFINPSEDEEDELDHLYLTPPDLEEPEPESAPEPESDPEPPGPEPEGNVSVEREVLADQTDAYVAQILEIIPDVLPSHIYELIEKYLPAYGDKIVEPILHLLFEDPSYPKVDRNGKRKRVEQDDEDEQRRKPQPMDYGNKDRKFEGGEHYVDLATEQLSRDFPRVPMVYLRRRLAAHNNLYAPTYLAFIAEQEEGNLPSIRISRKEKGKGKVLYDPQFEKERDWILQRQRESLLEKDSHVAEELNEQEYEDCGDGIECGCCFGTIPFDKMVQCPDAHLFCSSCITTYASTLLGSHDPNIVCMDQSGCKLPFSVSELRRFLSPGLMELYDRVKQRKEVEMAGLEGLEECPFCEYKVVIENEEEKLFRCERRECGAVSCRGCKKLDHLPKSCKEAEEDKHLDGRHAIEEAMTRALMRNCPKCNKAFIKEAGCNKMTCPNCRTLSCYICRQIIKGYDHFVQANGLPAVPGAASSSSQCILWDAVEKRHADEVKEAAEKALQEYKRDHPDIEEKDLKVDVPVAPPVAPPIAPPQAAFRVPIFGAIDLPWGHFPAAADPLAFGAGAMHHAMYYQQRMAELAGAAPPPAPPAPPPVQPRRIPPPVPLRPPRVPVARPARRRAPARR